MNCGLVAWGGESQKGWAHVYLSGQGCQVVKDWDLAQTALSALPSLELKRIDIAFDSYVHSFEACKAAYEAGGFSPPGAGRPPKMKLVTHGDEWEGSTIYVGSRQQAKYFRGYEKGKQLFGGELGRKVAAGDAGAWLAHKTCVDVDGQPRLFTTVDWMRHELEFKAKFEPLPLDMIDRRDEYFAGAYPYLGTLLTEVEPQIFVALRDHTATIELERLLSTIKRQYGDTLFSALVVQHGDIGAVWEKIVGKKHNKALLQRGLLVQRNA
jgi:phage replication initiation protein